MTNETIGHFALHPGTNTVGWSEDKGFFGDIQTKAKQIKIQPSELELRIRKEVMAAVDDLIKDEEPDTHYLNLLNTIKDRLNLLWSDSDANL